MEGPPKDSTMKAASASMIVGGRVRTRTISFPLDVGLETHGIERLKPHLWVALPALVHGKGATPFSGWLNRKPTGMSTLRIG